MTSVIPKIEPTYIESLSQYVALVSKKPENNEPKSIKLEFLYRGHSDVKNILCPSIDRCEGSLAVENRLMEQACNKIPSLFNCSGDRIELLAKMQHYGLPTRLIDFTRNPLVALFFACQDTRFDGEVLELNNYISDSGRRYEFGMKMLYEEAIDFGSPTSEHTKMWNYNHICRDYKFMKKLNMFCTKSIPDEGMDLRDFITMVDEKQWFLRWVRDKEINDLKNEPIDCCLASLFKEPIIVEAPETLQRQKIQQGLYLLIPNEIEEINIGTYHIHKRLPRLYHRKNGMGRYIIRKELKEALLHDLSRLGINEGFLFGDSVDHICSQIKKETCRTIIRKTEC